MNFKDLFEYTPQKDYNFTLIPTNNIQETDENKEKSIYTNIDLNLKYLKSKYNALINSDILIREFSLTARNTRI